VISNGWKSGKDLTANSVTPPQRLLHIIQILVKTLRLRNQ